MNDFYSNENCLYVPDTSSKKLIVIFSGVNANGFTGYKLFSEYKANKLFIRDPKKNWYNHKIENVSDNADDLEKKLASITKNFLPQNITFFGSSMGAYGALLFGIKLKIGHIVAFGPQVILNSAMPNNPSDMNKIIYPNIYELLDNNKTTQIDIYFGTEDVVDIYNIHKMPNYSNVFLHPLYGAPHDVMAYFNDLGLLKKVLKQHVNKDKSFENILPTYQITQNKTMLEYLKNGIEAYYKQEFSIALFNFTEIILIEPSWSGAWAFLGKIQFKLKLFDDALASLNKSFKIFYNTENPHFDAGLIYLEKKDYINAEYEIKQALNFATIQKNKHIIKLVISLREQGKIEEAFSYLDIIKERNEKDFGYLFQSGRLHLIKQNYESACFFFEQALSRKQNNEVAKDFLNRAKKAYKDTKEEKSYKLFASGDCILARRMHHFYEANSLKWIINDLPSITKDCDIVMTNLETVISNQGDITAKGDKRPFVFRGSPELLNILLALDVNLVTTANNHSVDYGETALLQQKNILNSLGIASPGSGSDILEAKEPVYFQVDDVTVAFISLFSFWQSDKYSATNDRAGVFHETQYKIILKELTKLYDESSKFADLVVLSPHWTKNWTNTPTKNEQNLARNIIDIGYDAIIGHSSHILHGIELYKEKPIIYDMGTFLLDNTSGHKELRNSACFVLTFSKTGFNKIEIYPLTLQNGRVSLTKDNSKRKEQKKNLISLSHNISKEIVFSDFRDKLLIECHSSKVIEDKMLPSKIYRPEDTVKSLENISIPKACVVLDKLPDWAKSNQLLINFDNRFSIIASKNADIFRSGTSFLLQVLLKVNKFDSTDRWEVHVVGKHIDGIDSFEDFHPISHGIYNPSKWEDGELVLDQAAIRPKTTLLEGTYTLFFGFYNITTKTYLDVDSLKDNKLANIGTVDVLSDGIPNFASGIDWDGKYSK